MTRTASEQRRRDNAARLLRASRRIERKLKVDGGAVLAVHPVVDLTGKGRRNERRNRS